VHFGPPFGEDFRGDVSDKLSAFFEVHRTVFEDLHDGYLFLRFHFFRLKGFSIISMDEEDNNRVFCSKGSGLPTVLSCKRVRTHFNRKVFGRVYFQSGRGSNF